MPSLAHSLATWQAHFERIPRWTQEEIDLAAEKAEEYKALFCTCPKRKVDAMSPCPIHDYKMVR